MRILLHFLSMQEVVSMWKERSWACRSKFHCMSFCFILFVLSAVFWGEGVGEYMGMFSYVQVQICVHTCKGQRSSTFVLGRGHRYHTGAVQVRGREGVSSLLPPCEFRRLNSGPPGEPSPPLALYLVL